jgi:hypothetical protein
MSRSTNASSLCALAALAFVVALCAPNALATTKPETPTTQEPGATAGSTSTSGSKSKAGAKASSGSTSSTGDQKLDLGSESSRFLSLALAPPSATPQLPPIAGCAARVTQSARSGWLLIGGVSAADALIDPTDCTLIEIRNSMAEACQYASAKQIDDRLAAKLLPGYVANGSVAFKDHAPEVCAAMKAPAPAAQNLIAPPAPPVASAPEPSRSSAGSAVEACATAAPAPAPAARSAGQRRVTTARAATAGKCTP